MEQIILHYGWQETPDGTYHSFRATDIENPEMSKDEIRQAIAEDLYCDLSDPDSSSCLKSSFMLIQVPTNTEYRLREQGRMAAKVANIDGPWSNNACEGYIIEAMQRCGYDADAIGTVCAELSKCFDEISVGDAVKTACGQETTSLAAGDAVGKYRCPKCGAQKFSATAHVTQEWELDGSGDFAKELKSCVETTHRPDEEDIWDCMCCGFSAPGKEFRTIH